MCESHTLSSAFQSRVIPMWWAELWWPESYSARTSGSGTHTLVTHSRGMDVAAAAIPVTRCRCVQSAAYHRLVCAVVGSLLRMPFYVRSRYAALPLLARQCGTLAALHAPCLLRRLVASQLLASRALVASHQLGEILGSGVGYMNCG